MFYYFFNIYNNSFQYKQYKLMFMKLNSSTMIKTK